MSTTLVDYDNELEPLHPGLKPGYHRVHDDDGTDLWIGYIIERDPFESYGEAAPQPGRWVVIDVANYRRVHYESGWPPERDGD